MELLGGCLIVYFIYRLLKVRRQEDKYRDEIEAVRRIQQSYKEIALSHGWKIDDIGEVPSGRYQLIWMYKRAMTSAHGELEMSMLISTKVTITFRNEFIKIPKMDLTDTFSGEFLNEIEERLINKY